MNLIKRFENLKGASFVGIKGYENSYGEVADLVINTNIDIKKAKEHDLEVLRNFDLSKLRLKKPDRPLAEEALQEMIVSAEKNLSNDPTERTGQSKGQSEAYVSITNGVRLNKETMQVQVYGLIHSKHIIEQGHYPSVNKRRKTEIKDMIRKELRMSKFRSYYIDNAEQISVAGTKYVKL